MGCTAAGYKTFLIVCNISLLFLGFAILSLGVKMKVALSVVRLTEVPLLMNSVKAVVATGFFICVTGGAGFCGACYEVMWLLIVHLGGLGFIVVMEFSLGVTLMVVKNTVEAALEETDCGDTCRNIVTIVVMKLATASAGTMLTIIIMEALMIYSAVQVYYHIRDSPKDRPAAPAAAGPTVVVQNVQMQNMAAPAPPQPQYVMAAPPPQPQYVTAAPPPQPQYVTAAPPPQQPQYAPQQAYLAPPPYSQVPPSEPQQYAQPSQQQAQVVPPLDTSTLTRKSTAKEDT